MAISERENILRLYRHEKPEHYPNLQYLKTFQYTKCYLERPADENSNKDWFGVTYIFDPVVGAHIPDPRVPTVISDITKWREEVKFPDLDSIDWEEAAKIDGMHEIDRSQYVLSVLIQCGLYERLHSLMGMEEALMAFLTEPEEVKALLGAIAEHKLKLFSKLIKYYKPDIIRHHDDYGTQKSMQMSPALWREMIKPHLARFAELCHSNGVFYEQHSCGLVEPVIPDFVEAGIDSWQGMMINNVLKLQKITKGKLNYHMGLDVQRYTDMDRTGQLTEEILRKDIRDTVTACAQEGNYFAVFGSPDRSWWAIPVAQDELKKFPSLITY